MIKNLFILLIGVGIGICISLIIWGILWNEKDKH